MGTWSGGKSFFTLSPTRASACQPRPSESKRGVRRCFKKRSRAAACLAFPMRGGICPTTVGKLLSHRRRKLSLSFLVSTLNALVRLLVRLSSTMLKSSSATFEMNVLARTLVAMFLTASGVSRLCAIPENFAGRYGPKMLLTDVSLAMRRPLPSSAPSISTNAAGPKSSSISFNHFAFVEAVANTICPRLMMPILSAVVRGALLTNTAGSHTHRHHLVSHSVLLMRALVAAMASGHMGTPCIEERSVTSLLNLRVTSTPCSTLMHMKRPGLPSKINSIQVMDASGRAKKSLPEGTQSTMGAFMEALLRKAKPACSKSANALSTSMRHHPTSPTV
mmetsp:Transcript_110523/g.236171  ORF Transcript_110523/g.236171 Transcript_110523/m.236171 type:complete len:334 (-) Transcript_110523:418-1419(-)